MGERVNPVGHPGAVVLFDGVCNLCNGSVNYVIDHDPGGYFRFAAQQGPAGRATMERHGIAPDALQTVILIEGGRVYTGSTAALRIARRLRGPARWLWVLVAIPAWLRDAVYWWIARNRYRWFGRSETCRMPTPELMGRFIDEEAR